MLVDVNYNFDPIANLIANLNDNSSEVIKYETGIYEIGHFNFDIMITDKIEKYPDLLFSCYGICDNYQQILNQYKEIKNSERRFVISITPIEKKKQPEDGGWRWHKWGPYIGKQKPKCEYLYDEPVIEKVYVYHIYEIL